MDNLNERIKKFRKDNGLTQMDLAKKLNITDKAVSKWENGEAKPDIELIIKLASIFNTTTDFLLTGKEPEVETIIISKMEQCCKEDDLTLFGQIKCYTDESGISILEYIEKYGAKKILAAYSKIADEMKNLSAKTETIRLALKYSLFDILLSLGALDYAFEYDRIAEYSLYSTSSNEQSTYLNRNDESYRLYGKRKLLFDFWPEQKILDYYFEFKSLDKEIENRKQRQGFPRSHFYNVDYTGVFLDFMTMAIDQKNVEKIKAIWHYVQKYHEIELNEYQEFKKTNPDSGQYYYGSSTVHLYLKPVTNDIGAFKVVSLSDDQIIELLKLGLFEIATEANEFAHSRTDWSVSDWPEQPVEHNQFVKYRLLAENPKADTRLLDVTIDGVVIVKRLLDIKDSKFIVETLKNNPIYECEKLYNLFKKKEKRKIYEFAVEKGILKLAASCFNDDFERETVKTIYKIIIGIDSNRKNNWDRSVYGLIDIDRENGYCFVEKNDVGNKLEIKPSHDFETISKEGLSLEKCIKELDDLFNLLSDYKREIMDKYSAKIQLLQTKSKECTKDFFQSELAKGNIENCVIKLCTLFEIKLKADGERGDFFDMMNDYCERYHSYDSYYGDKYCSNEHIVDVLKRLRIMRNDFLHGNVSDVKPLSSSELMECVEQICGWEVE